MEGIELNLEPLRSSNAEQNMRKDRINGGCTHTCKMHVSHAFGACGPPTLRMVCAAGPRAAGSTRRRALNWPHVALLFGTVVARAYAASVAQRQAAACKRWPWSDKGSGPWDYGGLFGRKGEFVVPPREHDRLKILGSFTPLTSLPQEEMAIPGANDHSFNATVLDRTFSLHAPEDQWIKVARLALRGRAKLAVIGCSTTSGCGSNEPWELGGHRRAGNAFRRSCSPA